MACSWSCQRRQTCNAGVGSIADASFGIAFGDAYIKLELIVSPSYALQMMLKGLR